MANEFCRLGQLDISPLFARVGHPEFTECSTPFVFHHPLVRPFSTRARTTHYIIYTYTYIYLYLYISIYIYISRVTSLRAAITVSNVARELFVANCYTDSDHRVEKPVESREFV